MVCVALVVIAGKGKFRSDSAQQITMHFFRQTLADAAAAGSDLTHFMDHLVLWSFCYFLLQDSHTNGKFQDSVWVLPN
jgi:hypothetical protein